MVPDFSKHSILSNFSWTVLTILFSNMNSKRLAESTEGRSQLHHKWKRHSWWGKISHAENILRS